MQLKKSYKGLHIFFAAFLAGLVGGGVAAGLWLPDHAMRVTVNILGMGMAILCLTVCKTEAVYWFNGTDFEQAAAAGSARRRAFALAHLRRFGIFALCLLAFSIVAALLRLPQWIDFALGAAGLAAVAVSTARLRL